MIKTLPILYSEAQLSTRPPAEDRKTLLEQIDSGEITKIDFPARVFVDGPNRNHLRFYAGDLAQFAASFTGQPFLRNHDTASIEARDGTITDSRLNGNTIEQTITLTTRRGMTSYVEGQIDRFSIGWFFDGINCSICGLDWMKCSHQPGRKYPTAKPGTEQLCELFFTNPKGKETSAVNAPAVDGTSILAALSTFKKETQTMTEPTAPVTPAMDVLEANQRTISNILGEVERQQALQKAVQQSNDTLAATCGYLLTSALASSKLPDVVQTRLRRQFNGTVFEAATLQAAIEEARAEVSALTSGSAIQGPGRISGVFNSADQVQAAFDDLMGAERDPGSENLKVARLSGIREAYIMMTGDRDFHGGYHPSQAQLATTTDFSGLVKNALNKMVVQNWDAMGKAGYDWWKKIVTVQHFESLQDITGTLVGTVGSLPTVSEGAEYTEIAVGDNPETASFVKRGGYIPLTLELIDRDQTQKLRAYPVELARAAMRGISAQVAAIFTSNSAVGPTMADTGALFNNTAVTTKGGHANLLTTALSATQWDVVAAAVYNQPMLNKQDTGYYGLGSKMAVEPTYCLVPRALRKTAMDTFLNTWDVSANVHSENLLKGLVTPLVVPDWTDANDWAAVCDPTVVPSIIIGERFGLMPQIFLAGNETDPAVFMNDETRIKVRHFMAVLVADFRPLHKENV